MELWMSYVNGFWQIFTGCYPHIRARTSANWCSCTTIRSSVSQQGMRHVSIISWGFSICWTSSATLIRGLMEKISSWGPKNCPRTRDCELCFSAWHFPNNPKGKCGIITLALAFPISFPENNLIVGVFHNSIIVEGVLWYYCTPS